MKNSLHVALAFAALLLGMTFGKSVFSKLLTSSPNPPAA